MMRGFLFLFVFLSAWPAQADQTLQTFQVTLAVAGTRQEVQVAPGTRTDSVIVQNPSSNTDSIFIGGSDVTTSGATIGLEVTPGQTLSVKSANRRGTNENLNTSLVFMVSGGTAVPVTIGITTGRRQ